MKNIFSTLLQVKNEADQTFERDRKRKENYLEIDRQQNKSKKEFILIALKTFPFSA